jgi:hypothetical protein
MASPSLNFSTSSNVLVASKLKYLTLTVHKSPTLSWLGEFGIVSNSEWLVVTKNAEVFKHV